MDNRFPYSSGWRDHNPNFGKKRTKRFFSKRVGLLVLFLCLLATAYILFFPVPWYQDHAKRNGNALSAITKPDSAKKKEVFEKLLIGGIEDLNLDPAHIENRFTLKKEGIPLIVESSVDTDFQAYIQHLLETSNTLKAAVVVMRPDDGRILAMASYDRERNGESLCLKADYPAASLFKIVSAAAAFEFADFSPDKTVSFVGRKHTLYKNQLKEKKSRYSEKISFKRAFASSINPVFGKLGIHELDYQLLQKSAEKLFFERSIPFDFPVGKSEVFVPKDDFGMAELASGFNKGTTISPLHAALLASAVVNDGVMMKPWIVKRVTNEAGEVLYENRKSSMGVSMSPETAKELRILMEDTVLHGTCRKAFYRERHRKAYKNVDLGAKTGTINDRDDRFKYDWLTAFVIPPNHKKSICIAVLGIHGKVLGVRANRLGRSIIRYYLSS
ncbi:penicillin-binding protein, transpeptidase domain protein [delta proteobacterium NaphS2]|nr:penicillin-binding protein, transpeptidase domain protein [delta proteobacterium NaphS2]